MPERLEVVLFCDREGCVRRGRRYWIESDGQRTEVILCDQHAGPLSIVAAVGRPAKGRRKAKRRDSSEARILSLIDVDVKDGNGA